MAISCFMAKIVSHHFERDQVPGLISRPSLNEQPGRWCLPRRHWGTAPKIKMGFRLQNQVKSYTLLFRGQKLQNQLQPILLLVFDFWPLSFGFCFNDKRVLFLQVTLLRAFWWNIYFVNTSLLMPFLSSWGWIRF